MFLHLDVTALAHPAPHTLPDNRRIGGPGDQMAASVQCENIDPTRSTSRWSCVIDRLPHFALDMLVLVQLHNRTVGLLVSPPARFTVAVGTAHPIRIDMIKRGADAYALFDERRLEFDAHLRCWSKE
jgi:hypothetical protein